MRVLLIGIVALAVLWAPQELAAQVFKCESPEGGVVFQQTPCPEPESEQSEQEAEAGEDEAEAPSAAGRPRLREGEDVAEVLAAEQEEQRQSEEVEACKQQYRDAIDAIDLEIQNSYTPDQREYYLKQLKALTEKMSAC